jgi:hypothetical protein
LFVFLARKVLALTLLVPGAALAAAAVLAGEIIFLLFTLGDLLDRLDISDERPDTA